MRITQVTVNFSETCNLGDYSNTKPSIELTALLDAGDDVYGVLDSLVAIAKRVLHDKIDEELERVSKPPKYWDGQRWDVIYSHTTQFVAIVPAATITQLDGGFYHYLGEVRYPAAQKAAQTKLGHIANAAFYDCRDPSSLHALRVYATEQNLVYEQRQAEKRRLQEEDRRRQIPEWEARQRGMPEEEAEEDEDEDDEQSFEDDDE